MRKCINCHQKAEKLDEKGFCEDCHDAMHPDLDYKPYYDHTKGEVNSKRYIK